MRGQPRATVSPSNLEDTGQTQRWLLKTEPDEWSWQNQEENSGLSIWDGVRNLQAQTLMKSMSVGDLCFFYHTGKLKEVAGIVRVVKTFYPDPTDESGKWGAVDVQEVQSLKRPVTLAQMKDDDRFNDFKMLRQPRLSVVPVDEGVWERVCELGEVEIAESSPVKEGRKNGISAKKIRKTKAEVGTPKNDAEELDTKITPTKAPKMKIKGSDNNELVHTISNASDEKQTKTGSKKRDGKQGGDEPKKGGKPSLGDGTERPTSNGSDEKQLKAGSRKRGAKQGGDEQKQSTQSSLGNGPESKGIDKSRRDARKTIANSIANTRTLRSGGEVQAVVVPEPKAAAGRKTKSPGREEKRVLEAEEAPEDTRAPKKRNRKAS